MVWYCLCDSTFSRLRRTPTCDRQQCCCSLGHVLSMPHIAQPSVAHVHIAFAAIAEYLVM